MAGHPTETKVDTAAAWAKAEHEAELLRVARFRAMPLRERLRALENRSRLVTRLRERRNPAPADK